MIEIISIDKKLNTDQNYIIIIIIITIALKTYNKKLQNYQKSEILGKNCQEINEKNVSIEW